MFTADLDIFFADDGKLATVLINGGVAGTVTVLFDAPGQIQSLYDGSVETTQASALMTSADVSAFGIESGYELAIDGVTWYVLTPIPDGAGMTRLPLSSVAP